MPCPFPGMDPWLEAPQTWPAFHDTLVIKTVEVLQPQLRSLGYYAKPGERVWLAQADRFIVPDVAALVSPRRGDSLGSTAALVADEPVRIAHATGEVHEGFVEIFQTGSHRLVTCIEYLSPANKSDPQGRELYRRKQTDLAEHGVHLVEIDLLRSGRHVLDVPEWATQGLRPWDYLVNLVRRGSSEFEVYPIQLRDRLPRLRVPLMAEDNDAVLDLQEVYRQSWEVGPWPETLDYRYPPQPPLSAEDAKWAAALLRTP